MTFTVNDKNWLLQDGNPVAKVDCPVNKISRGVNTCDILLFHYTAGPSALSAHNTYKNPDTKVSWHLTIDTDGSVHQLRGFRDITWHAGTSSWKDSKGNTYTGLNQYAIGIEMANFGILERKGGKFYSWTGREIPNENVFVDEKGIPWHKYTDAQLKAATELADCLGRHYRMVDVIGHQHCSPGRKSDPGSHFMITLNKIRTKNGLKPLK